MLKKSNFDKPNPVEEEGWVPLNKRLEELLDIIKQLVDRVN